MNDPQIPFPFTIPEGMAARDEGHYPPPELDPGRRVFVQSYVRRVRRTDPATSRAAAEGAVVVAGTQERLILEWLRLHPDGRTADELDVELFAGEHTANRRLKALEQQGHARPIDLTRATRKGRQARVWRAVDAGPGAE